MTTYDPATGLLTIQSVCGDKERKFIKKYSGTDLVGLSISPLPVALENFVTGKLYKTSRNLFSLLDGQVNEEVCARIEKNLGLAGYWFMGLVSHGTLLGCMLFAPRAGSIFPDSHLVENYGQVASIALKRHMIEGKLRESERQRAEEAIRASENYQKLIFDSAPAGIVVIDPKTHTIFDVNLAAAEMIGADKNQIVGSGCKKFFDLHDDEACPVTDAKKEFNRSECSLVTADNRKLPIIKTVAPVQLGGKSYLLETFVDISERKKAEDAIRASEKRFHDFADMLPQNVCETDMTGRITFGNKCGLKNYGYTHEDLERGMYVTQFMHPDDRERARKNFVETLTSPSSEFGNSFEFTALRKDGSMFPTLMFVLPIVSGNRVIGTNCIGIDLTERKKAEDALRASEKRFRDLAELLPQNVWETDATGKVTFANTCSYGMYGYQPEDIENGLNIAQLIHPDDRGRVMGDFVQALTRKPSEFPGQHEFTALRKDGSTFPLLTYHLPIVSDDKIIGMRGIGIDLTERKKAEDALRVSEKRFRDLAAAASPECLGDRCYRKGDVCKYLQLRDVWIPA